MFMRDSQHAVLRGGRRIAFPLGGTPPPARQLSASPPCILWQGILAGHLWSCRALLAGSWGLLRPSWSLLGRSWGPLGASWGALGGVLGPLECLLGRLGSHAKRHQDDMPKKVNFQTNFGPQRHICSPPKRRPKSTKIGPKTSPKLRRFSRAKKIVFKTVLGPSWADLGAFWRPSWAPFWPKSIGKRNIS